MNKDKIIKDLKERNDKLANQYRLRDIRCVHLEKENERLEKENQQLKEDKKKAREYIYLHSTQRKMFVSFSDRLHNQEIQFKGSIEDLLEILGDKGNENN